MNLIKFRNAPTKVTLQDGTVVQKTFMDYIYVPEYTAMIRIAPYDNQFVFEVPKGIIGPSYMCSCGSAAVFVGSNQYKHLGSKEGLMLVCKSHIDFGKHADGSS